MMDLISRPVEEMQYVKMRVTVTVRIEDAGDAEELQKEAVRILRGIDLEGVSFSGFEVISIQVGEE